MATDNNLAWEHRRVAVRPDQIPFLRRVAATLETNNLSTVVNFLLDDYKIKQQLLTTPTVLPVENTTAETDQTPEVEIDLDDFMD
ncbi:MAG: hypothetical protein F6K18_01515 [Okeania sp. SIO2C2]|uniref:hypothetical protein n=1 Tax=Okeania sp. SIO2C2 TaxID=2607787 RepID=UPI0013B7191C|nr:hypothetical protein [Okeania sp. SIO2C2]NEP85608.1 hypothetical protein [Okeania sp. SIO2C2]